MMKTCKRCRKEYLPGAGCSCRKEANDQAKRPSGETSCSALPDELDDLAIRMRNVSARMGHYAGFNAEIRQHAKELDGAANISRGWAKAMRAGRLPMTGPGYLYRCSMCRRTLWLESDKVWIKSYCLGTGKAARLIRMPNAKGQSPAGDKTPTEQPNE